MDRVFVYWDNSNIFISAQQVAAEREGDSARYRIRLQFRHMLELARAGREIEHAIAVGSIPPEMRHVWNHLENEGVTVQLLERGRASGPGNRAWTSRYRRRCYAMRSITTGIRESQCY